MYVFVYIYIYIYIYHNYNIILYYYDIALHKYVSPVGLGCKIHRLYLCKELEPRMSGYDTKQSDGEAPLMQELLWNVVYPFITITSRSTLSRRGSTREGSIYDCPVGWCCRIHRLLLYRGIRPLPAQPKDCSRYDTKQSDGEVAIMLKLWGMRSNSSLPSLPGLL